MNVEVLPHLNAGLNAAASVLLVTGWILIRKRHVDQHRGCMIAAVAMSSLFLLSYVIYHANVGSKPFPGTGVVRVIYFAILIAWLGKLYMHPIPALRASVVFERMRVGPLDGEVVLATVVGFYAVAVWLALRGDNRRGISDEIHGIEREMDHWKT